MPGKHTQHLRRTNLFLVRIWGGGAMGEGAIADMAAGEHLEWQGMVQRVVDGESHRFENMQDLVALLREMLSNSEGEGL